MLIWILQSHKLVKDVIRLVCEVAISDTLHIGTLIYDSVTYRFKDDNLQWMPVGVLEAPSFGRCCVCMRPLLLRVADPHCIAHGYLSKCNKCGLSLSDSETCLKSNRRELCCTIKVKFL